MTKKITQLVSIAFLVTLLAAVANGQGNNGRGKCMQSFGISFYKVKGGYEDEWLDLYMKWHHPLLEYALEHGTLVEQRLFVPDGHAQDSEWTFASSFVFPASQEGASAPLDRAGLIQTLFSEQMDAYVAGEKRRWEIACSCGAAV